LMKRLRKCALCGAYTMLDMHCGRTSESAHPPRYSPEDRYARYRRMERFGV